MNCTSSLVNWLVSIGDVGSWFCNCVISNDREVGEIIAGRLPKRRGADLRDRRPCRSSASGVAGAEMDPDMKESPLNAQAVMSKPARYTRGVVEAVVALALDGRPPDLRVVCRAE